MKWVIRYIRSSLSRRLSFWVVVFVAAIFTAAFALMFSETREVVREEAWNKATKTIEGAVLHIDNTLHRAEVAANNMLVVIESHLDEPDLMFDFSRKLLENNPDLTGCSISFEPNYYKEKGRYFCAYSYNNADSIQTKQVGTDHYQYHCMDWYLIPSLLDKPYWIEPYFEDTKEGIVIKDIFSSYSQPIHDAKGHVVGVLSVDIRLDWFSSTISKIKPYPHSYSVLLGKGGTYLVHPDTTKLFYETVFTQTMEHEDSVMRGIGEAMLAGETGHRIVNIDDEPCYVFYKPFKYTGWSVAIICPERDIFASYNKLQRTARITMVVGLLLLLVFCLVIVDRNLRSLRWLANFTALTTEGEFTDEVPDSKRPDEIGKLQRRFRKMQQSLAAHVNELDHLQESLQSQGDILEKTSEQSLENDRMKTTFLHYLSNQMIEPGDLIDKSVAKLCNNYHKTDLKEMEQEMAVIKQQSSTILKLLGHIIEAVQIESGKEDSHE